MNREELAKEVCLLTQVYSISPCSRDDCFKHNKDCDGIILPIQDITPLIIANYILENYTLNSEVEQKVKEAKREVAERMMRSLLSRIKQYRKQRFNKSFDPDWCVESWNNYSRITVTLLIAREVKKIIYDNKEQES